MTGDYLSALKIEILKIRLCCRYHRNSFACIGLPPYLEIVFEKKRKRKIRHASDRYFQIDTESLNENYVSSRICENNFVSVRLFYLKLKLFCFTPSMCMAIAHGLSTSVVHEKTGFWQFK